MTTPYSINLSIEAMGRQREAEAEQFERRLLAARDAFPMWRIVELPDDCFLAVPVAVPQVTAISLDGLVSQLRTIEGTRQQR